MNDHQSLGVIKEVNGRFSIDSLAVFDDSLVLVRGGFGYMLLRSVGTQFGALGALVLHPLIKRSEAKRLAMVNGHSPADLVKLHPKNRLIQANQIQDAELKKSALYGNLILKLVDGSSLKLKWRKGANKFEDIAPILRQALGTRLIVAA